jgi:hypothetical protein
MFARITGTGNGTAPTVNLTFPFLDKAHVKATVNGAVVPFTWTGASQIKFTNAVADGAVWAVYRDTSLASRLVDYTNGAVLTEGDLDQDSTQHQYVDQELSDGIAQANIDLAAETANRVTAVTNEQNSRIAADNAEAATRAAADADETTARIDAINNEAAARVAGDNAEASARTDAINSEAAARIAGDATEANNRGIAVANEANLRATGDANEQQGRIAGDAALQANLNSEAAIRSNADNALAKAILGLTNATVNAASRSILVGLTAAFTAGLPAWLNEGVRQGLFLPMTASDYAARTGRVLATDIGIDNTTLNGFRGNIILPVGGDLTGASGAWVFPYWAMGVPASLFGAQDNTDVKAAVEAWDKVVNQLPCASAMCWVNGTSSLPISLGAATNYQTKQVFLGGTIHATATMDVLLTIRNPDLLVCSLTLWGSGSSVVDQAWTSRLAGYGFRLEDAQNRKITGTINCNNFKFWGYYQADVIGSNGFNSNYASLPYIRARSCGISNAAGGTMAMAANWSNPVRLGGSGATSQTTTILVTAAPSVDPVQATLGWTYWLGGRPYGIKTMVDNGNGTYTLTLYYWIDDASYAAGAGSGSGYYSVGGVAFLRGSDTNVIPIEGVFGTNCGTVFRDGTTYGARPRRMSSEGGCDIIYTFGAEGNGAHHGGGFDELHIEGTGHGAEVLSLAPTASLHVQLGFITGTAINFAKWIKYGPRPSAGGDAGKLYYQAMTELASVAGYEAKTIIAGVGPVVSQTFDPGTLTAGASVTTTVSLPAQFSIGTRVTGQFTGTNVGLEVSGIVVNNDVASSTARVKLTNTGTGSVTPGSGTILLTIPQ